MKNSGLGVNVVSHLRALKGRQPWRVFRRRPLTIIGAVLAMLASTSLASAASVSPKLNKATKSTTIKPDFKFFKGKQITFLISGAPGGASSNFGEDQVGALAKILGATINVQFIPGANVVTADLLGAAKPDGLTFGIQSFQGLISAVYSNTATTNFPLVKATYIGAGFQAPQMLFACLNSPYTSFSQVATATKPVVDLSTAGASNIFGRLLLHTYRVPVQWLTGYSGFSAQQAGCLRGDGNVAQNSAGNATNAAGTGMPPGETPLIISGPEPTGVPQAFLNSAVPTVASYAAKNPPPTKLGKLALKLLKLLFESHQPGNSFMGPAGIPKARVLALTDAMKQEMRMASVKAALTSHGLPIGFNTGAAMLTALKEGIKLQPQVEQFLSY